MFSVGADNKLTGGPIPVLYDIIDNVFRPAPEAKGVIVNIDIVGTAASARIDTTSLAEQQLRVTPVGESVLQQAVP